MRLVYCLLAALACAPKSAAPPPAAAPAPEPVPSVSPWPGVFSRALRAADAGRFADADRALSEFAALQPLSPEGQEATFWRALLSVDPANSESTVRDQVAAFDAYLAAGPSLPRYHEAKVLRRMVEAMDSTRAMIVAVRAAADARERARGDEVKRLSDELEKTVAEMERIKRRLSARPPDEKRPPP
jgi:acyl-CoA reductase-like NAD-dependent aldehyde dehydrogenase